MTINVGPFLGNGPLRSAAGDFPRAEGIDDSQEFLQTSQSIHTDIRTAHDLQDCIYCSLLCNPKPSNQVLGSRGIEEQNKTNMGVTGPCASPVQGHA
jgi:hypothetical protein